MSRAWKAVLVLAISAVYLSGAGPGLAKPSQANGPAVTFTDGRDDAYGGLSQFGVSEQPPIPALSDPSADIESVSFSAGRKYTYVVSMAIGGQVALDHNYVVAGQFGDDCVIYHFLDPTAPAKANAFCDTISNGTVERRLIGKLSGSVVTNGGDRVSATFYARNLPAELAADRELSPLFAYTCVKGAEGRGCRPMEVLDVARSDQAFTIPGSGGRR